MYSAACCPPGLPKPRPSLSGAARKATSPPMRATENAGGSSARGRRSGRGPIGGSGFQLHGERRAHHRPPALQHVLGLGPLEGQVAVLVVVGELAPQAGQGRRFVRGEPGHGEAGVLRVPPHQHEGVPGVRPRGCAPPCSPPRRDLCIVGSQGVRGSRPESILPAQHPHRLGPRATPSGPTSSTTVHRPGSAASPALGQLPVGRAAVPAGAAPEAPR